MRILRPFCVIFGLCLLFACSSTNIRESETPEPIYNSAVKEIDDGSYLEATDLLNEVKRRFPQSRFAALADLKLGDLEYKQGNFPEAAARYSVFVELYPNHAEAAYCQYRKAESHLEDAPENIARDQSPAQDAIRAAETLVRRYPKSEFVVKANEIIQKGRLKLAQKEAYVARYYEKKKYKDSALNRWLGIENNFQDIKDFEDKKGAELIKESESHIQRLKESKDS